MAVWWIVFGVPLVAILTGWVGLCSRWRVEAHHFRAITAMTVTTAPVALANGALAYVSFVKSIPSNNYTVEGLGLLLSASAVGAAIFSARCTERWIPILTGSVSAFMLLLNFLMASTL